MDAPRRELQDERTALVNTLAALANHWTTLAQERQRALGALRAVETTRGGAQQPPRRVRSRDVKDREATRRPTPNERAARYAERAERGRTEWREEYRVPFVAAITQVINVGAPFIVFMLVTFSFIARGRYLNIGIILGILGYLAACRLVSSRTITCTAPGFLIERGFFPWRRTRTFYRWTEITALRYRERTQKRRRSGGGRARSVTIGQLAVDTAAGKVFEQTDPLTLYDFRGLLMRFSNECHHLPYRWIPSDRAANRAIVEQVGQYTKVAR